MSRLEVIDLNFPLFLADEGRTEPHGGVSHLQDSLDRHGAAVCAGRRPGMAHLVGVFMGRHGARHILHHLRHQHGRLRLLHPHQAGKTHRFDTSGV